MRGLVKVVSALAVVCAGLFIATPAQARDAEPTRVLILGDSITQGSTGDYTWRYFFWKSLQSSPESFDFVGPKTEVRDPANWYAADAAPGTGYADPNFDQDHAARWGMGVSWIDGTFDGVNGHIYGPSGLGADNTVAKMAVRYQPDVVVNMLGVNDLNPGRFDGLPVSAIVEKQRKVIMDARAANPSVKVLFTLMGHQWFMAARGTEYNTLLTAMVNEMNTPTSPVSLIVPGITDVSDTYDTVHPKTSGQVKIAERVRRGLLSVEVGFGSTPVAMPAAPVTQTATPVSIVPQPVAKPAAPAVKPAAKPAVAPMGKVSRVKVTRTKKTATVRWVSAKNSASTEVWKKVGAKAWKKAAVTKAQKVTLKVPANKILKIKVRPVSKIGTPSVWSRTAVAR